MVSAFAHLSYRQQQNQELLRRLSSGILALKLEAQGHLGARPKVQRDGVHGRQDVAAFLADFTEHLERMVGDKGTGNIDLAYSDLAERLIQDAQGSVADRIDQLDRLRLRLSDGAARLSDRDYRLLDRLQALLEEETVADMRGLFRF